MKKILKLGTIALGLNLCLAITTSARLPDERMEAELERQAQQNSQKTSIHDNVIIRPLPIEAQGAVTPVITQGLYQHPLPKVTQTPEAFDNNIILEEGKNTIIRLKSNRSTGYSWRNGCSWRLKSCTPENIVTISEYVRNPVPTNIIDVIMGDGKFGVAQFTVTPQRVGRAYCTFECVRLWDEYAAPVDVRTYLFHNNKPSLGHK